MTTIDQLKKVIEVLESPHVSSVEVGYEYEGADGTRFYTAITRKGFELHRYSVKVYFRDGDRFIKCNCAASQTHICRHALKVAQVDSDTFGIDIYTPAVAQYRGHLNQMKRAA